MELYDVMRTTFAAREFTDQPVSDQQLYRILDNARFAPSGGNRQGWKVIVVRDAAVRAEFVTLMRPVAQRYIAQMRAGESPFNTIAPSVVDAATVADTELPPGLTERLVTAPVVLVIGVDLKLVAAFDSALPRVGIIAGASIYPFVWNILLAARNEGLGGTLTTFLCAAEARVQELLGLPRHIALAALVPIGKPRLQLTRLRRQKATNFAWIDRFEGEILKNPGKLSSDS